VRRDVLLAVALCAFAQPVRAEEARPTATTLRAGLSGAWAGALGYRDDQTNKLTELSVETRIDSVADGLTQVRTSRFDEGPGRKPVWITTVSLDDPKSGTVTSATFRAGSKVETETEAVEVAQYASPTSWTLIYRQTGSDNDKPADIRVTETRTGNALLSVKEVSPVGAGTWSFRNQTRLTRVPPTTAPTL
jgi:hypothetical protein